jgi:hypothetical protein
MPLRRRENERLQALFPVPIFKPKHGEGTGADYQGIFGGRDGHADG